MANMRIKIKNNPPKAHLYRSRDDLREKILKKLGYCPKSQIIFFLQNVFSVHTNP